MPKWIKNKILNEKPQQQSIKQQQTVLWTSEEFHKYMAVHHGFI